MAATTAAPLPAEDELSVDLEHLTVGEIEEIEELTGLAIDALADPKAPKGRVMRALGYVVKRRADPEFTWEQAGALKVRFDEQGSSARPTSASA